MASKNTGFHVKKDAVHIKWVKKAQMWCKTIILNNNQKQEWYHHATKPSKEVENQEKN